jgi:hypothetical protein
MLHPCLSASSAHKEACCGVALAVMAAAFTSYAFDDRAILFLVKPVASIIIKCLIANSWRENMV